MKQLRKIWPSVIIWIIPVLLVYVVLQLAIPKAPPIFGEQGQNQTHQEKELLNFVALGDSLTEGVGDTTASGGYVPLLKQGISEETSVDVIHSDNYGKAGDRSDQILKRLKKSKELQKALKKADFITLTAGGNDLMKVIKSEFMNDISYETFDKPRDKFQANLKELLLEIRKYNKTAPIYQMGIYNPFYLNFQEMTEMQDIVDFWNQGAKEITSEVKKVYFIPINDLLYKGLDGQIGIGSDTNETTGSSNMANGPVNNLISEVDNFHPNNLGYQIMAKAFKEQMLATKAAWLEK